MADTASIVASAMAASADSASDADTGDASFSSPAATEAITPAEAAVSPSSAAAPVAEPAAPAEPVKEPDELTKALEELGIKAPELGKDNRIPHSRVVKITENYGKKLTAKHQTELTEVKAQAATAQAAADEYARIQQLIDSDPERYIQMLAVLNPEKYGKYAGVQAAAAPAAAQPAQATNQRPPPDIDNGDGTFGYSQEGLDRLLDWQASQTASKLEKVYNDRFGPIEQEWKTNQTIQQKLPQVRAQIAAANKTWGADLVKAHEVEIQTYMHQHPDVPFHAAIAEVLMPKVRVDRATMKADLLKEVNARPAAAQAGPVAPAAAASTTPSGPRTTTDIVKEAMAAAGIK